MTFKITKPSFYRVSFIKSVYSYDLLTELFLRSFLKMCTIPPAPPPPSSPPLYLDPSTLHLLAKNSDTTPTYNHLGNCEWASEHPDLREACSKNSLCQYQPPFQYKYTQFESILQVGPTCGLVALSMLVRGEVERDTILQMSKDASFSHNGEMFSCKDMAKLAEKVLALTQFKNVEFSVKTGGLFSKETIDKLLEGALLLVPYDSDSNHSPCLKKGHTAHWALICGVIVLEDPGDSFKFKPNNVFVFSRHGKSKFVGAWSLEELEKSNKNLWEFSPRRGDDGGIYILPEGGVGGQNGLRDQYLMFEGL